MGIQNVTIQPVQPINFSQVGEVEKSAGSSTPFLNVLKDAVSEYASLQEVADAGNAALALGQADNPAQVQIDSFKAEAAFQTTVQLTSRVVNAYKEIMQMSI